MVRQLNESLVTVLKCPTCARSCRRGGRALPMTPEQFGEFMRADIARWTKLARARNIQLDAE
jgi:hypothetical protein